MDKKSIQALGKLDPQFARLAKQLGVIELRKKKSASPFQALVESVIYQQLSGKAAGTILKRFIALYPGQKFPKPEQVLSTAPEILRSAGISNNKAASIRDIAQKTLDGTIPSLRKLSRMHEEDVIAALTCARGVGRWTAEMFLIFRLGRPDILPTSDLGIQKGFMKLYGKRKLPSPDQLRKHGSNWHPHRTTAALYLWRVLDSK
jgi:DNA-3-methyladenine glycosylase II